MTVDPDALRAVVRESWSNSSTHPARGWGRSLVSALIRRTRHGRHVHDDDDLRAFVLHVLRLAEDPVQRRLCAPGQIRFALGRPAQDCVSSRTAAAELRVDRGALTEKAVVQAAPTAARLCWRRVRGNPTGPRKARTLGVSVRQGGEMKTGNVIGNLWSTRRLEGVPTGAFLEVELESRRANRGLRRARERRG